jgi:hypothetical protein
MFKWYGYRNVAEESDEEGYQTYHGRQVPANISYIGLRNSVADPDPSDPYVFGPPGSGSMSQRHKSGSISFYHQAQIARKTLIPTVFKFFSTSYL